MSKSLKALIMLVIFLIGVALIVLPLAYKSFERTTSADEMMEALETVMNDKYLNKLLGGQDMLMQMHPDEDVDTHAALVLFLTHSETLKEQVENYEDANALPLTLAPLLSVIFGGVLVLLALVLGAFEWRAASKAA